MQQIIRPSALLAPYIRYYWTLDNCINPGHLHIQRIIPTGCPELLFYFKNAPVYRRPNHISSASSFICGQQTGFYNIEVKGTNQMLAVVFQPYGLKAIFNISPSDLLNSSVEFSLVNKKSPQLEESLQVLPTTQDRISLIESFLLKQLCSHNTSSINRISHTVKQFHNTNLPRNTAYLASEACLSRKQFERYFTDCVGITPGKYMRIIRFQKSLFIFQTNKSVNITNVAYDCDYYDQSHMIAEYKSLSGYTPRQLLAQCEPYSDFFTEP